MPYLTDDEIKIGTPVLVEDATGKYVCIITKTPFQNAYKGFVSIMYPCGRVGQHNRAYIRRLPNESR